MKLFKTYSEKEVKRVMPIVKQINELEAEISKLSDSELRGKTEYFKKQIKEEGKTLDYQKHLQLLEKHQKEH